MEFTLQDPINRKTVARVHLNGYSIAAGGPLGQTGAMRSFTLLEGEVHRYWDSQQTLILRQDDGQQVSIRIAALPAEKGEIGFIEFL